MTKDALLQKAKALRAQRRHDEALALYAKARALAPDDRILAHNFAGALGDAGRYEDAVTMAETAFAMGLDAPETWLVYARALQGALRLDEAEAAFETVLAKKPGDVDALRELVQLLWMRDGNAEKALARLDRAGGPSNVGVAFQRARALKQMARHEEAADAFETLARRFPREPIIRVQASHACLDADRRDKALDHALAALALKSDDAPALIAAARAYLAMGEPEKARDAAQKVHRAQPEDQGVIALLATAWRILGDPNYERVYDYDRLVKGVPIAAPKGWAHLSDYLRDLSAALMARHHYRTHPFDQSVRWGSQIPSIEWMDAPALKAWPEAIAPALDAYVAALKGDNPVAARSQGRWRSLGAWSVLLWENGRNADHYHQEGWISSACHILVPDKDPADAPYAGDLRLGKPGFPTEPTLEAEVSIRPEPGVIRLFPSYMWHGTVPYDRPVERLAIAADFLPD